METGQLIPSLSPSRVTGVYVYVVIANSETGQRRNSLSRTDQRHLKSKREDSMDRQKDVKGNNQGVIRETTKRMQDRRKTQDRPKKERKELTDAKTLLHDNESRAFFLV